jgi:uncharacterized LabA/DUF88 family protein
MPLQSDPPTPEERARYAAKDRFIYRLKSLPRFEVRLGRLRRIGREYEQKRVDVMLSVDLVRLSWAQQIRKAVLVTGDSDYVPAIQAAKDAGVLVVLYYCRNLPVHDELLLACDDRHEITQDLINSVLR